MAAKDIEQGKASLAAALFAQAVHLHERDVLVQLFRKAGRADLITVAPCDPQEESA